MPFFFRPRRLSADFLPVPHEPSAAERADPDLKDFTDPTGQRYSAREVVAVIDSILDGQQALAPDDRNVELIDVLLDVRNLLAVPVIPGRSA
jgi:hypothetical protein